jgi:hypothetical protein
MSTALAIAATTAALRDLLVTGMTALDVDEALGGGVDVTVDAPDRAWSESTSDGGTSRLNLFLYNISRNTGYTGNGLPSRDATGARLTNPVLGLDLCYLLSAYGVDDFHNEILLGGAIQVLHETPALSRDAIRDALDPATHPQLPPELRDAGLADQFEYLKVSPLPMSTEETSRVWSSINSNYRPSVAYVVSVVLMQGERQTRSVMPVARRVIRVVPFRELRIDRVISTAGAHAGIDVTSTLRILGRNLAAPDIAVWVNSIDVTAGVVSRAPDEIRVELQLPLPPAPPPRTPIAGLHPGVAGVQLVQPVPLGDPETAHEGFASNVASFVVVPRITPVLAAGNVDVTCAPPIGVTQRVRLLLNQSDAAPGVAPRSFSFNAPPGNGIVGPNIETDTVRFAIPGVPAGRYIVRLQVDGAMSLPTIAGGHYAQPEIVLP